jgi:hypothetical protein
VWSTGVIILGEDNITARRKTNLNDTLFITKFIMGRRVIEPEPPSKRIVITRWFKYDRDDFCVNKSQFVPVIFEPPCTSLSENMALTQSSVLPLLSGMNPTAMLKMRNSTFVKLKIQPKCFKKPPSVLALFKEG